MSEKPKKGNSLKLVIIVLLGLIVVGGAAFGGMILAGKKGATPSNTTKAVETKEVTYSLDECLVNLTDSDAKRYLKVLVYVGYGENEELSTELKEQKPVIRDSVIKILRSKKTTDFSDTGVDIIKKEIIAKINPVLTKGKIDHIYFNDLLVQ
ncbi:flagellar basal body-associated FliL family protein [Clostridium estertheticum]|uniref:flagellar basal body-associated FliL family protein n=1 Tax=Clostridium estertheticum TaxID=238834 RepID=UPI001CF2FC2C|nr:flagellar basal body-associated FliL family protein [Clostridium estertheticum]MCB2308771.1 flagellar basal body-associated FliL family protein [Clostridium estertheticum]MCB2347151.1 flagellar basal body-associated FliL family protein [Clostridium estertheticum]MCB2351757.1 flagellar basal body-associated FliL family protein [Clostridium estertheticum]WAG44520.1 flagellar basal body-associated FliL family protein [Clostridium estertheticum]